MTLPTTQSLSDGELFATIENGIRLNAMPGWGDGTAESGYGSGEVTSVFFFSGTHVAQLQGEANPAAARSHFQGGTPMPHQLSAEMKRCIEMCHECHDICVQTVYHCLEKGGRHAEASHIRLLLDCGQICHTSEDFILRGSDLHTLTCGVCAEVCARCADSCRQMGDDEVLRRCAEVCLRCADSCAQMAGSRQMAGVAAR